MKQKKTNFVASIIWGLLSLILIAGLLVFILPENNPRRANGVQVSVAVPTPKPEMTEPLISPPVVGDEKTQPPQSAVLPGNTVVPEKLLSRGSIDHPLIAIVIDDMGLDLRDSKRAMLLPAPITLSYMPYAPRLGDQTHDARDHGHELLLHMPMEPVGRDDPGPDALLVNLSPDDIRQRFQTALASFVGFDGVNNHMGSRFTSDASGMTIVIDELKQRQLFFFDSRTSAKSVGALLARDKGVPTISRDVFLDDEINTKSIDAQLLQTENIARRRGYAVAIGHPHGVTLDCLERWSADVTSRGFTLVPLHDLVYPELVKTHQE
jgi:hypothetical protein